MNSEVTPQKSKPIKIADAVIAIAFAVPLTYGMSMLLMSAPLSGKIALILSWISGCVYYAARKSGKI